jgi:hypothetical protein
MRAVHLSDMHFAALALKQQPPNDQAELFQTALCHADIADKYRKKLRRAHPEFGTGTLTSAMADRAPVAENKGRDTAYLQSMLVVVTGLLAYTSSDMR